MRTIPSVTDTLPAIEAAHRSGDERATRSAISTLTGAAYDLFTFRIESRHEHRQASIETAAAMELFGALAALLMSSPVHLMLIPIFEQLRRHQEHLLPVETIDALDDVADGKRENIAMALHDLALIERTSGTGQARFEGLERYIGDETRALLLELGLIEPQEPEATTHPHLTARGHAAFHYTQLQH